MTWATSGNAREFFAAKAGRAPASPMPRLAVHAGRAASVVRLSRRLVVVALAGTHLVLLGELAVTPASTGLVFAAAVPAFGASLPWLTITGLLLAALWLVSGHMERRPLVVAPVPAPAAPVNSQPQFDQPARRLADTSQDTMAGLLARVSHDLRTPLNAVMGFSDLMQRETFGPLGDARYRSYAHHIHESSVRLLKAAEDTLAMTSLVAAPRITASEVASLHDLVADAFATSVVAGPPRPSADRGDLEGVLPVTLAPIVLAMAIAPDLQVKCERRALRQALTNLFAGAAARIAPVPGVTAAAQPRVIYVTATPANGSVELTIRVEHSPAVVPSLTQSEELPVCLARALLDLQGLPLAVWHGAASWNAQVILDGVAQSDFFPS
jgi:signal transduction histidine kinase